MEKVRAAALVQRTDAVDFAAEAFAATGMPPADARKAAEALVDADLHGTVTHGLKNLRNYVSGIQEGQINPRPNIRDMGGAKSARILQRRQRTGPRAATSACRHAIDLAREYGVGTAYVRDSNHSAPPATGRDWRCGRT